LVSVIFLAYV